jgi:hypothetical protein
MIEYKKKRGLMRLDGGPAAFNTGLNTNVATGVVSPLELSPKQTEDSPMTKMFLRSKKKR